MSQNSITINDGTGAQVLADINAALDTLATLHSGATAPGNPQAGMLWVDTSATPARLKIRNSDNTAWTDVGSIDEPGLHTAQELLDKIKTVDGAGSGLDSDLLDGLDSSQFLRADVSTENTAKITAPIFVVNRGSVETRAYDTSDLSASRIYYLRAANQFRIYPLDANGNVENSALSIGIYYNGAYEKVWHDGLASKTLLSPGYFKMPNGVIIQFGSGVTEGVITLPITFPNAFLSVVATLDDSNDQAGYGTSAKIIDNSSFSAYYGYTGTVQNINYIAIGY